MKTGLINILRNQRSLLICINQNEMIGKDLAEKLTLTLFP